MDKRFNTTGTCFPEMHYMVDITERLVTIKKMIIISIHSDTPEAASQYMKQSFLLL